MATEVMEVKDYCRNVNTELTGWKAKIYDIVRHMDNLPTGDKQRMFEHVNELHILMTELEDRIDQLQTQCPTEWSPQREEIKTKLDDLSSRYNNAKKVFFDYEYGG